MGIDTSFRAKGLGVNTSWKRFAIDRNVTIAREATFTRETSFFTIGSCFANEVRHALEKLDFDVLPKIDPSIHHLFPEEFKANSSWGLWDERVQLQFYNTFSIRQEFEKAFGLWEQSDDDYFAVARSDGTKYWDPYRRALYATSPEGFTAIKRALDKNLAGAIHGADAVVITLGMTEAFFRKDNGLATCQYNRFFDDRVDFRATGYEENFANIDKVCELYFGKYPDRRIVLTVSPVGLAQTFRDEDVVVANMESKATLRTVAAAIARKWPNIVYWPSFEIVLWNENSWQPDIRHVHPERIASIMDAFVECHVAGIATTDSRDRWAERAAGIAAEVAVSHRKMIAKDEANAAEQERLRIAKAAAQERLYAERSAERAAKAAEQKRLYDVKMAKRAEEIEHRRAEQQRARDKKAAEQQRLHDAKMARYAEVARVKAAQQRLRDETTAAKKRSQDAKMTAQAEGERRKSEQQRAREEKAAERQRLRDETAAAKKRSQDAKMTAQAEGERRKSEQQRAREEKTAEQQRLRDETAAAKKRSLDEKMAKRTEIEQRKAAGRQRRDEKIAEQKRLNDLKMAKRAQPKRPEAAVKDTAQRKPSHTLTVSEQKCLQDENRAKLAQMNRVTTERIGRSIAAGHDPNTFVRLLKIGRKLPLQAVRSLRQTRNPRG